MSYYRPKVNDSSINIGDSTIITTNWPGSTSNVILAGDIFRFDLSSITYPNEYDDEYTVDIGTYNSDSSGGLTLSFTPTLPIVVPNGTGIILKNPRIITTGMKTAVTSEVSNICYFMQFNFYNNTNGREELVNLNTSTQDLLFNWFDYELNEDNKVLTDGIQALASTTLATKNWLVNSKTLQRGNIITFSTHTQTYTVDIPTSHTSIQVNGGGQTGTSINLKGFTSGVSNVIRAGDILNITGATPSLVIVKYNASADGSGYATVQLSTKITGAPSNNASVDVTNYTYYSDSDGKVVFKLTSGLEFQVADNTQLSKKWQGIGGNLTFQQLTESTDLAAQGTDLKLSGVDQSIISVLLQKKYIGRYCRIFLSHVNSNGIIISHPKMIFWGRMNGGFEVEENRDNSEIVGTVDINLRAVDRMGDLQRIKGIQTNLESHQKLFPGDKFFQYVDSVAGKIIRWGPS